VLDLLEHLKEVRVGRVVS
jgi:hypothetical protein